MISIGCFSGFWGDSPSAAIQIVNKTKKLDYLVGDYLAEVTMGILARLKSSAASKKKSSEGGYVTEFIKTVWEPLVKEIAAKNIKVITNAGGMNPVALKKAMEVIAAKANVNIKIAAVEGDDFMDQYHNLQEKGEVLPFNVEKEVENIDTSAMMLSCNAYLGAFPIAEALAKGAQVVVTGRMVDSAIVLGPLIYEFGWKPSDYDLLAAGSVIGHIIECGCHATGGNFTDWAASEAFGWDDVGYPIAECYKDGSAIITKPENTGGLVSVATVAEQLVYEIMDPASYYLPDVIVDLRNVVLEQLRENTRELPGRVKVTGAKGRAPTPFYKASLTSVKGFKMDCLLMIGGIDARLKGLATANAIISKTRKIFQSKGYSDYADINIETLGSEHSYGPQSRGLKTREIILRITVTHPDIRALNILSMEISPSALSMAPGITGSGSGRPQHRPNVLYSSCLVKKSALPVKISVGSDSPIVQTYSSPDLPYNSVPLIEKKMDHKLDFSHCVSLPLVKLCHGRSGDKGDVANIGIICRKKEYLPYIEAQLTPEVVKSYMGHLIKGNVYRYSLPGINAFNFVCTQSLGGGGMSSLNMDRQGKCYAQMLLDIHVKVPENWGLSAKL